MRKVLMIVMGFLLLVAPSMSMADEETDLKKKIYMDKKKLVVLQNMEFTEDEAAKFWPIYEAYQEKIFDVKMQYGKLVGSYVAVYKTLSESEALMLVDEYYQLEEQNLALMKEYAGELKTVLPGQKVLRYIQVENKLETISKVKTVQDIPMAQ